MVYAVHLSLLYWSRGDAVYVSAVHLAHMSEVYTVYLSGVYIYIAHKLIDLSGLYIAHQLIIFIYI